MYRAANGTLTKVVNNRTSFIVVATHPRLHWGQNQQTPLHCAAAACFHQGVELLIRSGADVHAKDTVSEWMEELRNVAVESSCRPDDTCACHQVVPTESMFFVFV